LTSVSTIVAVPDAKLDEVTSVETAADRRQSALSNRIRHRLEAARRHDQSCHLCEHRCGVNREQGERGKCQADAMARVFRHRVECGEEPELVPCHLFYLSGCDLRCAFCIAEANAFDASRGTPLTPEFFRDATTWGKSLGARTLQWVGGEPSIHLPRILDVLETAPPELPIVWKSDFYSTTETLDLLAGIADVYVADFKFGNDECAKRIASVENYLAVVTRNLLIARTRGRLIVRHLLMPGHLECCFYPVLRWLRVHLPTAAFSLRGGYLPRWRAKSFADLSRRVTLAEMSEARGASLDSGLEVIL
jgi:putative pyruvate formate lyase activating enzyme